MEILFVEGQYPIPKLGRLKTESGTVEMRIDTNSFGTTKVKIYIN